MDELAMVLYKRRTRVLLFGHGELSNCPKLPDVQFSRGAFHLI